MIAWDTETHAIVPGTLAPKGVVSSWAWPGTEAFVEWFAPSLDRLREALMSNETIAGANIAYDFAVALRARPDLAELVFEKYQRGEVWEVFAAQALDAIAKGHLFQEPGKRPLRTRGPDGVPFGKARQRYSLETCAWLTLGLANAKENDEFRLRYAEFEGVPFEQWPDTALQYPKDDAAVTLGVATKQQGFLNQGPIVRVVPQSNAKPYVFPWTHHTHHARAAFAMHLSSVWGMRTDAVTVDALEERLKAETEGSEATLTALGYLKPLEDTEPNELDELLGEDEAPLKRKKNGKSIKAAVLRAYSSEALTPCPVCKGTGKVKNAKGTSIINCVRFLEDGSKEKTCDATGYTLQATVPRSAGGGVKADRDTLEESHDEGLELLAEIGPLTTIKERFIPWLKEGTRLPLNVRPNVLVATGRASYDGIIQTIPSKGGVRECFIPRPGHVFCSVDYNALELSTFAQTLLWTVGFSTMADAINSGKDLHTYLAAQMVGLSYDALLALVKAESAREVDFRSAAKAGNFGFGGMMGAPKFVLTQRKKGLRMCRLAGREPRAGCGADKVYEWKKRPCPPTCRACCEFSEELRQAWLATWFEVKEYFKWVSGLPGIEDGEGIITSPGTGFVRAGEHAPSLANHGFQHIAAMGAKHALWNVTRECYVDRNSPLYGTRISLFLHDELIAEMPEEVAHEAGHRMAEVMVSSMREFIPDVHVGAEPALMRRWYKGAKTVYENGRLVPWEPKAKAA